MIDMLDTRIFTVKTFNRRVTNIMSKLNNCQLPKTCIENIFSACCRNALHYDTVTDEIFSSDNFIDQWNMYENFMLEVKEIESLILGGIV